MSQNSGTPIVVDKKHVVYLHEPQIEAFHTQENPKPVLFVVNKPKWTAVSRLDAGEVQDVAFTLRERIYRYLLRQYPHPARVRYAYIPDDQITKDYDVIFVDSTVTDIRTGNGVARYVLGYGAGATVIQAEGSFFQLKEGEPSPLLDFALRQRHGAYPNGIFNTKVTDDAYCLKYGTEAMIEKLTTNLPNHFVTPELRAQRASATP
ncbi:MAG: DUF4410 domain-containing protein [Sumerlaeia bacterium]